MLIRFIGLIGAVAMLAAALPRLAISEPVQLSLPQARIVARQAYAAGDIIVANRIGHGLLQADPRDPQALVILAATEPLLGRPRAGRVAGRLAFGEADERGLKREAAFFASRAAAAEGRFTAAQFWLRRAYQQAETDEQRDGIASAFRQVRAANPWRANLAFNLSPNSNVNGGSSSEFLVIDDTDPVGVLSGSARALSGYTASVSGELTYALSRGAAHRTTLGLLGFRSFNTLSADAKDIAPDASGSDFDYGVLELRLSHAIAQAPAFLPDRYAVAIGQTWYGGDALDRLLRGTLSRTFRLTPELRARVSGEWELRRSDQGRADREGTELRLDLLRSFGAGHLLSVSLITTDVRSDTANSEYTAQGARIGLTWGEEIAGIGVSGVVGYTARSYDAYSVGFISVPGGREDEEWTASIDFTFDGLDVWGFAPVVSLNGRQSSSNVSRFEGESLGLSVGFQSAF